MVAARTAGTGTAVATELAEQGLSASAVVLDVTDVEQARVVAKQVAEDLGRLDVLVNNAGILPEATATETREVLDHDLFQQTFATNVLGAVAVTESFLPLLRQSPAGRIVNVSSAMGSLAHQTDPASPWFPMVVPAYQSSKAALNAVTVVLAKALADTPVKVTSVCPGWVQTDLAPGNREQAPLTPEEAAEVVVRAAMLPDDAASGTFVDASGPVAW